MKSFILIGSLLFTSIAQADLLTFYEWNGTSHFESDFIYSSKHDNSTSGTSYVFHYCKAPSSPMNAPQCEVVLPCPVSLDTLETTFLQSRFHTNLSDMPQDERQSVRSEINTWNVVLALFCKERSSVVNPNSHLCTHTRIRGQQTGYLGYDIAYDLQVLSRWETGSIMRKLKTGLIHLNERYGWCSNQSVTQ